MKYFCLVVFILLSAASSGQSINGVVRAKDGLPLELVTVTLRADSATINATLSDQKGNFYFYNLKESRRYHIIFSLIGYDNLDTAVFIAKGLFSLTPILIKNSKVLKEVVITTRRKLIERKIDRLVFNVENNVNTIGMDGLDLLSKTPMVRVEENGVSLVGKSTVEVMIDNKLTHVSGEALTALLKSLQGENISKIEVITNPSAEYDAAGNSGIINIVTKKTKSQGFLGSISSDFSHATYNTYTEGLSLNYNWNKLLLFGNASVSKGPRQPSFDKDILYDSQIWEQKSKQKEFTKFFRGTIGFEWLISKNTTIGASYNGLNSRPDLLNEQTTTITNRQTGSVDSVLAVDESYGKTYISNSANLHFRHQIDSLGKELIIDGDIFNTVFDQSINTTNSNFEANGQLITNSVSKYISNHDQRSNGKTINAMVKIPFKRSKVSIGGKLSFVNSSSGVDLFKYLTDELSLDSSSSNQFDYRENIQAFFGNFNTSFGKFELQVGLRGEFTQTKGYSQTLIQSNKLNYFNLFPTFYIAYELNKDNSLSLNFGRRIGRPGFSSLNPFRVYLDRYSYYMGNPFLKPSFSNNFELSHTYKSVLTSTLSYGFTNGLVSGVQIVDNGSNLQVTTYGNYLNSKNFGLDESFDLFIVKWLESVNEFSIYYNSTKSNLLATSPKVSGAGGDFRSINSIFFNKSKTFIGGISFTYQFPDVSGINNNNSYYYLDLSASYLLFDKRLQISTAARDVFKTKNISSSYLINGVGNSYTANNDSRRFLVSLKYSFGSIKMKRGQAHNESSGEQGRSAQ